MRIGSLILLLAIGGCRKDVAVDLSEPTDALGICTEFDTHTPIEVDTLFLPFGEIHSQTSYVYFSENNNPSFYMFSTTSWYSQTDQIFEHFVSLRASSLDSMGIFSSRMIERGFPFSFEPGDTLDPYVTPHSSLDIVADVFFGGPSNPSRTYYYYGIIQIIEGKKHAGYVRVSRIPNAQPNRFWVDYARIATCPGQKLVIE